VGAERTVPVPSRRVYLDWNATTPPLPAVVQAMAVAAAEAWGNPSSVHAFGRAARRCVEEAREAVAALAGCDARDVTLTSGGTEANNLALRSAFAGGPGVLVTSRLEHPSVTRVAETLESEGRAVVRWLRVREVGTIDLDDLVRQLEKGDVRLVALQAVNSETGVVQPVTEAIAMARGAGARIHVDAVQAFGRAATIGAEADTRALAGHKIRGPKGIGALISRLGVVVQPVLVGGSQEGGVRPGTLDPVAAAGLAAAARHAETSHDQWQALAPLRDRLEANLLLLWPGSYVNGGAARRLPNATNVAFPGWEAAELVAAFDLEGVAVSAGTSCSAGTAEPSAALRAMGKDETARSSVRFSLGEDTTHEELDATLEAAARILRRL
jgi:cysteine desulfurase